MLNSFEIFLVQKNHSNINNFDFLVAVSFICQPLPNIIKKMKNESLETIISNATSDLIDMATDICWNKISRNCEFIMSEIKNNEEFSEQNKTRNKLNAQKIPKSLNEISVDLKCFYEEIYDINLHIYNSLKNKTIIEIRYFLKSSFQKEFYSTIKDNEPMLYCKINKPPYASGRKFDVNWELGGIRHEWNLFWYRIKNIGWYLSATVK